MSEPDHLARAVVQGIAEQMERNTFSDVQVVVEGLTFECHRFLLSSCSEFFRALLTSGMREDLQRRVEIHGIEQDTFRLVLDCLYKAKNILKPSNVFDVWDAANQLQIGFLLDHCEMFLAKELCKDNCVKTYIHAKLLDSQNLKNLSRELIQKEFEYIRKHDDILQLDLCDLKKLVADNDLDVPNEDVIIDLILRWIDFHPIENGVEEVTQDNENENISADHNSSTDQDKKAPHTSTGNEKVKNRSKLENEGEHDKTPELSSFKSRSHDFKIKEPGKQMKKVECGRKDFLPDLLTAARVCLISSSCLQILTQNKLVLENPKAFAIVQDVLRYQLQPGRRHDYCPPHAMHRSTSRNENILVAIIPERGNVKMSGRTHNGSWFQLAAPPAQLIKCNVVAYENDLYATSITGTQLAYKYDSNTNTWRQIANLNSKKTNHALVCLDNFIYAVGGDNCTEIEKFDAGREQKIAGASKWEIVGNLKQAVLHTIASVFGNYIVVVGCLADGDTTSTIQSFNVHSLSAFNYLDNMPGSAKNMVTFSGNDSPYILQESGSLWKITCCDKSDLSMEFLGMLWDFTTFKIQAAGIQNQELLILGGKLDPQAPTEWEISNQKSFKRMKIIQREANCFINTTIQKTFLTVKEA